MLKPVLDGSQVIFPTWFLFSPQGTWEESGNASHKPLGKKKDVGVGRAVHGMGENYDG